MILPGSSEKRRNIEQYLIDNNINYSVEIEIPNSTLLKKLIINEEEAKTIKLIFNKYAYDNLGLLDIAKLVNQMGLKTKTGNKFENRTIKYILRNPVYIGKLRYSKKGKVDYHTYAVIKEEELYDGIHERIIDEETWNTVQKRLDKNILFSIPHKIDTINADYWLKGIVRCPYCNCTMIRHQKVNLRCNGYGKGKCHNKNTINLKFLGSLSKCLKAILIARMQGPTLRLSDT